jgi:hypothetical protein
MASKYKKLAGAYPVYAEEATYQERIDSWKRERYGDNWQDADMAALAATVKLIRAEKQDLEKGVSDCNLALEALSQMMAEALQADALDSMSLATGQTVSLLYELYPSVKNKDTLRSWCEGNGLINAYQLPWSTLRGVCNDLGLAGRPLPDGVEGYMKTKARVYGTPDKGSFRHPPEEGASIGDLLK